MVVVMMMVWMRMCLSVLPTWRRGGSLYGCLGLPMGLLVCLSVVPTCLATGLVSRSTGRKDRITSGCEGRTTTRHQANEGMHPSPESDEQKGGTYS